MSEDLTDNKLNKIANMGQKTLKNLHSQSEKNLLDQDKFDAFLKLIFNAEMCSFSSDNEIRLVEIFNCLSSLKSALDFKFAEEEATKANVVEKKLFEVQEISNKLSESESKKKLIEEQSNENAQLIGSLKLKIERLKQTKLALAETANKEAQNDNQVNGESVAKHSKTTESPEGENSQVPEEEHQEVPQNINAPALEAGITQEAPQVEITHDSEALSTTKEALVADSIPQAEPETTQSSLDLQIGELERKITELADKTADIQRDLLDTEMTISLSKKQEIKLKKDTRFKERGLEECKVEKSIFSKLIDSITKVVKLKIWELGLHKKFSEGINQKTVFNVVYKEKLNQQDGELKSLKAEQMSLKAKIGEIEISQNFTQEKFEELDQLKKSQAELSAQITAKTEELAELQKNLDTYKNDKSSLEKEFSTLKDKLKEKDAEYIDLQKKYSVEAGKSLKLQEEISTTKLDFNQKAINTENLLKEGTKSLEQQKQLYEEKA